MVVNDLDLPCFTIAPRETDTPSFVDTNAVVPAAVALQRLKPITGRCSQIIQSAGGLERQEFRPHPRLYPQWQPTNGMASEDGGTAFVDEALDHSRT